MNERTPSSSSAFRAAGAGRTMVARTSTGRSVVRAPGAVTGGAIALSGGRQQRVAIARALTTRPRSFLLHEVTSALDPELVGSDLHRARAARDERFLRRLLEAGRL